METENANVIVSAYVTSSERAALAAAAKSQDRKVSAYVRLAIREKMEREALDVHGAIVGDPSYVEGERPALDALLSRLEARIAGRAS